MASSLAAPGLAYGKAVIAFTSFEEPAFVMGAYTDPDTSDHQLSNLSGQPIVEYIAGTNAPGVELGFTSFFSGNLSTGLSDGDFIGVKQGSINLDEPYPDGTQGYRFQDTDGTLTMTLDAVDLTPFSADPTLELSFFYYVSATGWEGPDGLRIWVEVDGGQEINLVNPDDVDDLTEGTFIEVTQSLTGFTTATFNAQLTSSAPAEEMWVDLIRFTVIPEPSALVLSAVGLGLLATRRRPLD
ncbi:MAG: PEP-CTERM sorting domain-containing protein [Planctomycetota bacterium]